MSTISVNLLRLRVKQPQQLPLTIPWPMPMPPMPIFISSSLGSRSNSSKGSSCFSIAGLFRWFFWCSSQWRKTWLSQSKKQRQELRYTPVNPAADVVVDRAVDPVDSAKVDLEPASPPLPPPTAASGLVLNPLAAKVVEPTAALPKVAKQVAAVEVTVIVAESAIKLPTARDPGP